MDDNYPGAAERAEMNEAFRTFDRQYLAVFLDGPAAGSVGTLDRECPENLSFPTALNSAGEPTEFIEYTRGACVADTEHALSHEYLWLDPDDHTPIPEDDPEYTDAVWGDDAEDFRDRA